MKFHGNPSSGSRADTCRQTDRQRDTTKLKCDFRDYANAREVERNSEFLFEYLHRVCQLLNSNAATTIPTGNYEVQCKADRTS